MKIREYPEVETLEDTDSFIVETGGGTKQIKVPNMQIPNGLSKDAEVVHRNIYRGKNLGSEFTDAQKEAIRTGTFTDLYIGDYWEDGTAQWVIVDIDRFFTRTPGYASTEENFNYLNTHHIVVWYDGYGYKAKTFNSASDLSKGYYGSNLRASLLSTGLHLVEKTFGRSFILPYANMVVSNSIDMGTQKYKVMSVTSAADLVTVPNSYELYGFQYNTVYFGETVNMNQRPAQYQFPAVIFNPSLLDCKDPSSIYPYSLRDVPVKASSLRTIFCQDTNHLTMEIPVRPMAIIGSK